MAKDILIVEDEKPIGRALELKLSHAGFDVQLAYDGKEGLEEIRKEQPRVLILDLVMPQMDGFAVLEVLKEQGFTGPIFVLSNLSQPEDEERVKELGAKAFYVKSDVPLTTIVEEVIKALS